MGIHCFSFSRDLVGPRDQKNNKLFEREPLMVSHNPAKFGGHRHCDSRDINVLVSHVILKNHIIKVSCDVMGRSLSWLVTNLPILVTISIALVEIRCFWWLIGKIPHTLP